MKRVLFFLICLIALSCGQSEEKPVSKNQNLSPENLKPVSGDWLIYHLPAEPATLNPITATDAYEGRINSNIYETLVKRDNESLELKPLLAESWEISDDKLS
ncbi:MAG: hypothetical protein ACRENO_05285, partial [Thermodesulfobacteriota bacterium]